LLAYYSLRATLQHFIRQGRHMLHEFHLGAQPVLLVHIYTLVCPHHLVETHSIAAVGLCFLDKLLYVIPRFVYDFCISKVDNESAHLAYSLLELTFVRSGSLSLSKNR